MHSLWRAKRAEKFWTKILITAKSKKKLMQPRKFIVIRGVNPGIGAAKMHALATQSVASG